MTVTRYALAIVALVALTMPAMAQDRPGPAEDTWVTVSASAAGTDENAKDEAVAAALRTAVEQACGVFIKGQSKTEDYQTVYDKVLANTAGYVLESKVLKVTRNEADEKTTVRVKARVSTRKFEEDWASTAHTIRQEGNPRVMVVIAEATRWTTSGPAYDSEAHGTVQSKIEDFFIEKGLDLVDKDTAEKVSRRDILLATMKDDIATVAALGAKFKADVVVIGKASAQYGRHINLEGASLHKYNTALNIRVVQSDSAKILTSKNFTPTFSMTTRSAEDQALSKLGDKAAPEVFASTVEAWRKRANVSRTVELTVSGMTRKTFSKFKEEAAKIRGVQEIHLRELTESTATIEIEYKFDTNNLADRLEQIKSVPLEITEQNANRLKIKVVEKL